MRVSASTAGSGIGAWVATGRVSVRDGVGEQPAVVVEVSPAARVRSRQESAGGETGFTRPPAHASTRGGERTAALEEEAQQRSDAAVIRELSTRDIAVRNHEAAHVAASGGLAGVPSYSFEMGPDGKAYAVGGEVSIDLSSGRDPQETISRARRIRAAALAPADPSAQDLAIAGRASAMELKASRELLALRAEALARSWLQPRARGEAGSSEHLHLEHCGVCETRVAVYQAGMQR
jgi:hypothetical protein